MIAANEKILPFVTETAVLPPGFKPLCSSTPKRSRKQFGTMEKPLLTATASRKIRCKTKKKNNRSPYKKNSKVTTLSPTGYLKLSQFLGDIPSSIEKNNQTMRTTSNNNSQDNFVENKSKTLERSNTSNRSRNNFRLKTRRSTSSESWNSFQKHLDKLLNTSARDLDTIEKILKLDIQSKTHSKNKYVHDDNSKIMEHYAKIRALKKISKTFDVSNTSGRVMSFEYVNDNDELFEACWFEADAGPSSNDKIILKDDCVKTETSINEISQPIQLCEKELSLEFSSSSTNKQSQRTPDDVSINVGNINYNETFFEMKENADLFDKISLLKPRKIKHSGLKTRKIQQISSSCLDLNDNLEENNMDNQAEKSLFEEDLEKFRKKTISCIQHQIKVPEASFFNDHVMKFFAVGFDKNESCDLSPNANSHNRMNATYVQKTDEVMLWDDLNSQTMTSISKDDLINKVQLWLENYHDNAPQDSFMDT